MKLMLIILISISIISCSSDNKQRKATNSICLKSNLNLAKYKSKKATTMDLPSNPNKSGDEEIAKDGIYILTNSIVHVHDLSRRVPDKYVVKGPQYLQFSIAYSPVAQTDAEKESNIKSFAPQTHCLSGMLPEHAGKLTYQSNVPTTIEVKERGSKFVPKTMSNVEFGYKKDRSMKYIVNPINEQNSVDKIEDINDSDGETITNIYRTKPTGETYQLQSRVNQGDIVLTIINTYARCVSPHEEITISENATKAQKEVLAKKIKAQEDRTQEENDKLEKEYELCKSRAIKLKSRK